MRVRRALPIFRFYRRSFLRAFSAVSGNTNPTSGILLENGTDFLLLETGDFLLQE